MRVGRLKRSIGQGSKIGCVLDFQNRYMDTPDLGYFMDKSVYGHRCQNLGSLWNLDGRRFDGVNDSINCGHGASLNITGNEITFEMWLNVQVMVGGLAIRAPLEKATWIYAFYLNSGLGKIESEVKSGGVEKVASGGALTAGKRYYVAGVYDGANVLIYLDTIKTVGNALTGNIDDSAAEDLSIGDCAATGRPIDGLIDKVRILNYADYAARILSRAINGRRN